MFRVGRFYKCCRTTRPNKWNQLGRMDILLTCGVVKCIRISEAGLGGAAFVTQDGTIVERNNGERLWYFDYGDMEEVAIDELELEGGMYAWNGSDNQRGA